MPQKTILGARAFSEKPQPQPALAKFDGVVGFAALRQNKPAFSPLSTAVQSFYAFFSM